MLKQNH